MKILFIVLAILAAILGGYLGYYHASTNPPVPTEAFKRGYQPTQATVPPPFDYPPAEEFRDKG